STPVIQDGEFKYYLAIIAGQKLVFCVCRDITERKRAEEALRRIEQEKIAILDSMSEIVVFQDMEHRLIWANKAAGESVNLTHEQLAGRYCYEVWHQRNEPCVGCPITKAIETDHPHQAEMTTPDGRVWFVGGYPVRDANGDIMGIVESALDITERKQAEEQTKQLQEYLQLQINRMPIGLIVWDTEFHVQTWNPATERIFGFTAKEALGKHPYDLIVPKETQPHVDDIWRRLLAGDMTAYSINENITKDGRTLICEWSNTPLKEADGIVVGVLSM
ncbi:unnamed protein product, partial [marine sediment metagenome]